MYHCNLSAVKFVASVCIASAALAGCNKPAAPPATDGQTAGASGDEHAGHSHVDEHGHSATGPRGGAVIELGTEEYHAELVHDEASSSIVVYLLDRTATKAAPVVSPQLVINLSVGGKGKQFKLAAAPDTGDAAGMSSRFTSKDGELIGDLDAEHAKVELVADINGKQYRGVIEHRHDHDESAHKHE